MELHLRMRGPLGRWVKGFLMIIVLFVLVMVATMAGVLATNWVMGPDKTSNVRSSSAPFGMSCNVTGLEIHGCIDTYDSGAGNSGCDAITTSQDIVAYIENVEGDGRTKAILLDIDSPGGTPQAAAEIADAIHASKVPVIAWIRGSGDSAAYWIASAASTIIAASTSDIGSIGVTQSYLDNAKQNSDSGLTYNSLSTGKFKDTGSPDKALTADERSYLEAQLQDLLDQFITAVATSRQVPEADIRALADGSSMLGEEAKKAGLIDTLGFKKEVWAELEAVVTEKPTVCWPQYAN